MAMAVDLQGAGFLSYSQMSIAWVADTLKTKSAQYAAATSPLFSDVVANDRTVGNWLVPIYGALQVMPATSVPNDEFNQMVEYIARMCFAGYAMLNQGLISAPQAAATLAAWNAAFGT
jgi:hypothetical protein